MSVRSDLLSLAGEIRPSVAVLKKITAYYEEFCAKTASQKRSTENAIIISDIVVNFYTCLETIFVRISYRLIVKRRLLIKLFQDDRDFGRLFVGQSLAFLSHPA